MVRATMRKLAHRWGLLGAALVLTVEPTALAASTTTHRAASELRLHADDLRVADVVGEALYRYADEQRAAAAQIEYPTYRGNRERADVERYVRTQLATWIRRKELAIARADRAFAAILKIRPGPPPRWVVAASAALGAMWQGFVAELYAAPYPRVWDQPGFSPHGHPPVRWHELRAHYWAGLARASRPYVQRAAAAYRTCRIYEELLEPTRGAHRPDRKDRQDRRAERCPTARPGPVQGASR